ncbi:MAG: hypothetical protein KDC66_00160 [Phaeodactylibacter sp.]|nr:hypothetical protein [Phaeodactylibacter sp.]
MRWQFQLVVCMGFVLLFTAVTPVRAQGLFTRKTDKQEEQAAPAEEKGLFSAFRKKEQTPENQEKGDLKTAHKDAKADVRAYKKERKAAEAREEAARARADAIKAQRRAERAEGKADKAGQKADKARQKADDKKSGRFSFWKDDGNG